MIVYQNIFRIHLVYVCIGNGIFILNANVLPIIPVTGIIGTRLILILIKISSFLGHALIQYLINTIFNILYFSSTFLNYINLKIFLLVILKNKYRLSGLIQKTLS